MLTATGNYGYKLSKEVLQEDSKLGACPEIANLHNKRFVLTCEPKKSKCINTSTMKEITGNPTLNARQLYKNMVEGGVLLKLTLFLEANKLPILDEVGEATERRVNVFPFESRFLKEADYLKLTEKMTADEIRAAHVFVGDPRYKTDEWKRDNRQALIFVLMDYFKQFQANNYTMGEAPEQCATAKKEYMQESDNLYGWFESVFEKTEGGEPLGFKDIYNIFTLSNYYNNLTKKERKDYNLKKFTKEISENLFLAASIRKRDSRYNGVALKKDSVVGWRLKPDEKAGGGAHDDEACAEEK
jgi:phage/plasmid-associated DNA primase